MQQQRLVIKYPRTSASTTPRTPRKRAAQHVFGASGLGTRWSHWHGIGAIVGQHVFGALRICIDHCAPCSSSRRPSSAEPTMAPTPSQWLQRVPSPHTSRRLSMPHISTLGASLPPIPRPCTPTSTAHCALATSQARFDCVARVDAAQRYFQNRVGCR